MPHLAVFASNNSGLSRWNRTGSLYREVALYKKFAEDGWNVSFYTYDRSRKLPDVGFGAKVYPQWPYLFPKKLSFVYCQLIPFLHFHKGREVDIIITNQAHSSGSSVRAGRLWRAKVIARCGYVYGESAEKLGKSGRRVRSRILKEKSTFQKADKCIVPTKQLEEWIFRNYGIRREKIAVIPNYVDTEQFQPDDKAKKDFDIICIGRLVAKKRHKLLLDALSDTRVKMHIIGAGRLENSIKSLAKEKHLQVKITRRVENKLLPQYINSSKIYVNLSEWEGHPKALIEAMASGCACVGADSPGINNIIIDGQTGILVNPEARQTHDTIEMLLRDRQMRERLGRNAREYAVKQFSLDKVFEGYKRLLEEVLPK